MGEIKKYKVGELVVNFDRKRKPLSGRQREKMKGIYPYYGAACIFDYINDYIFDGEYILLGEDGTVVNSDGTPVLQRISGKSWVNNHAHVLSNSEIIDFDYLYYVLKNTNFSGAVTGAVQPKISQANMNAVEVEIYEDKKDQKKVAGILKLLDEKIKLNNKINDNLSMQIQLLFKSNFVDSPYDFVPCKIGNLPIFITDYVANGSFASLKENVTLLDEPSFAYFIRNTDLKSGKFNVFVDEHSYNFLAKSSLYGNEIIVSNVGDIGSVFLCPFLNKPMTLGNNVIMIRPRKKELLYFMFIWLKWFDGQQLIQGIKGGSAVSKFNKTEFKNIVINIPHDKQLASFDNLVKPMFEKMRFLKEENLKLSNLRDSLLPKLMSGEIDVNSIEL